MSKSAQPCGYEPNLNKMANPTGDYCCCRPVPEGFQHCVWHENKGVKDIDLLKKYRADGPELLDGAVLRGANIGNAISFEECRLFDADLSGAVLTGGNLRNADIRKSNLAGTLLRDARMAGTNLQMSDISESVLTGANFKDAHLGGACLFNVEATKTDFTEAGLAGANLSKAEFNVTDFTDSVMTGIEITEAEFHKCNFSKANLRSVDFSNVRLGAANFTEANLRGANFSQSFLKSAVFNRSDLVEVDFTDAMCEETTFNDADLTQSRLEGTRLRNARLSGANLEEALMIRTDIRNTDLSHVRLYEATLDNILLNHDTDFGEYLNYETDGDELEKAVWSYRRLYDIWRENGETRRSRRFYIRHKEANRKLAWETFWQSSLKTSLYDNFGVNWMKSFFSALQKEASRWSMNHGESPWRVIITSIIVIVLCAGAYPLVGGIRPATSSVEVYPVFQWLPSINLPVLITHAITHFYFSVVTFTTLGYGDFQPAGPGSRLLASFESFVGALLMALLVFVLGRRATW